MFKKIEHIGIAVKNLSSANEMFEKLSELGLLKVEEVVSERVLTSFFQVGETKIEFLEAKNPESAIAKYIERVGEGIHHIAFEVDNVETERERLLKAGFETTSNSIIDGADNKRVFFLHPKTTGRVLIEICQEKKD